MKALVVVTILALSTTTGCLVKPASSPQALRHVRGPDLNALQLMRNMRLKKNSAKSVLKNNGCGDLLEKPVWYDTETGNGYFTYRMKKKGLLRQGVSCNQQFLSIDLQAIFYMAQHSMRCSLDRNNLLQLHVPNSNERKTIKADCKTRSIDLSLYNNTLRVATFEDNGSTSLATVDRHGKLGSGLAHIIEGISPEKLAEIKKLIDETSAMHNFSGNTKKLFIAGTGTALTGLTAFIAGEYIAFSGAVAVTAATASVATGAGLAVALVAIPLGVGVALGMVGGVITKAHHSYLEVVPALRAIINIKLNGGKVINVYEEPQPGPSSRPSPRPT